MPVYSNTGPPQPLPRVAGNFSVDNTWYRAEVLEIINNNDQPTQYKLRYIDYGNTETVTVDRIRALPPEFQKTPAQAKKQNLHILQPLIQIVSLDQKLLNFLNHYVGEKTF